MRAVGQEGWGAAIVDGPFGWQSEQVGQNRGHTQGEQFAHSKIAEIAGKMICPRTPLSRHPCTPAFLPPSYAIIFFSTALFCFLCLIDDTPAHMPVLVHTF